MRVAIVLEDGREIKIQLYPEVAPKSVENFLKLVDRKYYDGVIFHRVIEDFMIQTGGYTIVDNMVQETEEVNSIYGEFRENGFENNLLHEPGVISMARTNVMNSASSQFFICSATCPHLDGKYAAFGKVMDEASLEVVMSISRVETCNFYNVLTDFPVEPVIIKTIKRID